MNEPSPRAGSEPAEPTLGDLVAEALAALESGGPEAVEALVRAHPRQAAPLLERLAALRGVGLLGSPELAGEALPQRLGGFRLVARLGGGGMGVVYLAEEVRLGRRVALKVVRPDQLLFQGSRARFEREAQAVARLAHPAIVPLFSVGEDGGVPWFAMEFVRGATLAEVIAELRPGGPAALSGRDLWVTVARIEARRARELGLEPAPPPPLPPDSTGWARAAADVVRRAAEAVAHAHGRGVLHRDVKPSNVLLAADGRVLLFDFGLATSADAARLTESGTRVGSLAYMAPEQLDGSADERSDVYGLGITLYELLTLELPFAAQGGEALAAAVRQGAVIRPRRRDRALPADLETVVLAGLERDPRRRYASAEEFAADLARVLELRPIRAKPPGPALRARRLVQRHPGASAALFFALLLLIAAPAAWIVQERRGARQVAAALARADHNLERALDAVYRMLVHVGERTLAEVPAAAPARRALLADAVAFYAAFLEENAGDPRLERAALRASTKQAWALWELGEGERAREASQRAAEQALAWFEREPGGEALVAWARALDPGLQAARSGGDLEAVAEGAEALLARLEPAYTAAPRDGVLTVDLGVALATALDRRANVAAARGEFAAAEPDYRRAAEVLTELLDAHPENLALYPRAAMALNNLGNLLITAGRAGEAIDPLLSAREWSLRALAGRTDGRTAGAELAALEANLASALGANGDISQQLELFTAAAERLRAAVADLPERIEWRRTLAAIYARQAQTLERGGRLEEALEVHRQHVELARGTFERTGGEAEARVAWALALANQAGALRAADGLEEAAEVARAGLLLLGELGGIRPQDRLLVRTLFQHLERACLDLGDHAGAVAAAHSHVTALGNDPNDLRIAAGALLGALELLEGDGTLPAEARAQRAAAGLESALEWLAAVARQGRLTRADLERAPAYAHLRARADFEELAARLLGGD